MKLVISIIHKDDASHVSSALTKSGFYVTKLATTGGFLKKGNVTFLVGTEDEKVPEVVEIVSITAKKRAEKDDDESLMKMQENYSNVNVETTVGGATIFVVEVERFEKA